MRSSHLSCSGEQRVPYGDEEAREAWLFVNKYGPSNAWTGFGGTAARMIGRLLKERERLIEELKQKGE